MPCLLMHGLVTLDCFERGSQDFPGSGMDDAYYFSMRLA